MPGTEIVLQSIDSLSYLLCESFQPLLLARAVYDRGNLRKAVARLREQCGDRGALDVEVDDIAQLQTSLGELTFGQFHKRSVGILQIIEVAVEAFEQSYLCNERSPFGLKRREPSIEVSKLGLCPDEILRCFLLSRCLYIIGRLSDLFRAGFIVGVKLGLL